MGGTAQIFQHRQRLARGRAFQGVLLSLLASGCYASHTGIMRILFRPRAPLAPIFGICRACPAPVRHAQAAAGPRARISVVLALGLILFASISGRAAAGVREQLDELITLAQGKRLGFITNPSGCDEVGGLDCVRPRMGAVRVSSLMIVQNRGERQGESELKIHCIRDPREESD